jgi:hypothetical protein
VSPERVETAAGDLADDEADAGQITDGHARATETGNEDLVVLVTEAHATVTRHEAGDSLIVFFELHTDALTDTGVGLLGFDTDLLDDDAAGVGGPTEGLAPLSGLMGFLVVFVGPLVVFSFDSELATSINTTRLVTTHFFRDTRSIY